MSKSLPGYPDGFNEALQVGRPPNVSHLFPNSKALLVSGEHTGNLGVVNTRTRQLEQVIAISRPIPGCVRVPEVDEVTGEVLSLGPAEPHVHGVNIQHLAGTVYVSDEGEDCFYESVTVLKQADDGDDDDDDDD